MWDLGQWVAHGGPWALAVFILILLAMGWLIPLRQHNRELGYRDRTIAALEATVAEREKQLGILLSKLPERPS